MTATALAAAVTVSVELAVPPNVLRLLDAMEIVESGGNPNAVGDAGRSLGPLQIGRDYWRDSKVPGQYRQVRDRAYARRVVLAYWARHCAYALRDGSLQWLARVHNGGKLGPLRKSTIPYWNKVRKELSR